MSKLDQSITNESVIPVIESDIFAGREDQTFAIGMLAIGGDVIPGRQDEFSGYLRLRANVYAHQTRMISPDLVRPDGTEMDEDDARSIHWAVFERAHEQGNELGRDNLAKVVGSIRTIIKTPADDRLLPIEDFFPEAFDEPLPVGALEVSRYICRHELKVVQKKLSEPLFLAVISYVMSHDLGPTFGVVEPIVEDQLAGHNVPMRRVAEPQYVPDYAADNLGFEVFIPQMAKDWGIQGEDMLAKIRAKEQRVNYFNVDTSPGQSAVA